MATGILDREDEDLDQYPDQGAPQDPGMGEDSGNDWDAGLNELVDSGQYGSQHPTRGQEEFSPTAGGDESEGGSPAFNASSSAGVDGEKLQGLESGIGDTSALGIGGALPGEADATSGNLYKGKGLTFRGQINAATVRKNSGNGRRGGIIAGGVTAVLLIFVGISSGSLDTSHYKNNFIQKANAAANRSLQKRRAKNIISAIKKATDKAKDQAARVGAEASAAELAVAEAAKAELTNAGFNFVEGAEPGSISAIEFTDSAGKSGTLNLLADDLSGELDRFFTEGGTNFTDDFIGAIKPENELLGEAFRGPAATAWFERFNAPRDVSVLEKAPQNPNESEADTLKNDLEQQAKDSAEKPTLAGESGLKDPNTDSTGKGKTPDAVVADAQAQTDTAVKNLTSGTVDQINAAEASAQDITSQIEKAGASDLPALAKQIATPELAAQAAEKSGEAGIDPLVTVQEACKDKGAIDTVNHVRRYAYELELVRFGFQWLAFADAREAGYSSGKANALMELWMHRPNTTTGQTFGNGGATANAFGDTTVHASSTSLAKYSGGFASAGILATISSFIRPFATACKAANNTFLNIGVAVIGIATLIASDGAVTATGIAQAAVPTLSLVVAGEIIRKIATPILIRAGAHLVMSGLETGDVLEAAVTSGVMNGMSGIDGSHSLRPVTAAVGRTINYDTQQYQKRQLARASIFDRYLNIKNEDSLLGRMTVGFAMAKQSIQTTGVQKYVASIASSSQTKIARSMFPASYALAGGSSLCSDPAITDNPNGPISSGDFCSVNMEFAPSLDASETEALLLKAGEIDNNGAPKSDNFKKFISQCSSGSPSILYENNVKSDGSGGSGATNLCIEPGSPLAGETKTLADAYNLKSLDQPKFAWWQKAIGNSAWAAPASATSTSLVGINYRYSAWLGYLDDISDSKQTLTKNYGDQAANTPSANQTNNNVFVLGDSLTVGMNSLPSPSDLTSQLTKAGWTPTVNAQGCRGVYQPSGPIAGDGHSCPKASIIDGLSAITDTADTATQNALKNAGTYVIALGTNGYEANSTEFEQKAAELVKDLKALHPVDTPPTIYWLNVRLKANSAKADDYDAKISQLVNDQQIRLMDWNAYVTGVNGDSDPSNDVTWPATDSTHNDTNGYTKKIQFIIDGLGTAPTAGHTTASADCSNPVGNAKIVCAGEQYVGIRYGYSSSQRIQDLYHVTSPAFPGLRGGASAAAWLKSRTVNGPTDFIDCSGYANLSMYVAFGYATTAGCSGYYVRDNNHDGLADADKNLKIVSTSDLQPGDFLTESLDCNSATTPGHVAIFVSKTKDGKLLTLESSGGKNQQGEYLSGFHTRSPSDFPYASRYIGPGSGASP